MQDNIKDNYSLRDVFGAVAALLRYLVKKSGLILAFVIAGGAIGFGLGILEKPKYEAVITFILEEKSMGGGGLAGIASQFGLDLGSVGGGASIFAGDNILDILRSKAILQKVLLSRVDPKESDSTTLADMYLSFKNWKKKWSAETQALINFNSGKKDIPLTAKQDSVLNRIYVALLKKSLSVDRINKKGSIIRVIVVSENSRFAQLMTERLVEEAGKMYLGIKTGIAQANIDRMQRRADSLLAQLNSKSYSVAAATNLDVNPGLKGLVVPTEIATRDKTVIGILYTEISKNLEISKMLLSQQTPAMQILDKPFLSLEDKSYGKLVLTFLGSFIFLIFATMVLAVRYFLAKPLNVNHVAR
jgi:uncharacterized protein involved in exopolysaccharide biosynthesis